MRCFWRQGTELKLANFAGLVCALLLTLTAFAQGTTNTPTPSTVLANNASALAQLEHWFEILHLKQLYFSAQPVKGVELQIRWFAGQPV
jgi:hypothetical protein